MRIVQSTGETAFTVTIIASYTVWRFEFGWFIQSHRDQDARFCIDEYDEVLVQKCVYYQRECA